MKTKQFLLTLLLLLGGASSAWAQRFSPEAEILYRTNGDNSAWNSGFPKAASETNNEFEMKYYAGFYALQKYTITDLSSVTSLTLNIAGPSTKGTDAIAIWAFSDNDWTNNPTASELTAKVTTIVGIAPHATTGDANTGYLLNTCGSNRETTDGVQYCHFVINGDALTSLKEAATGNTFTLLITNRTQDLKTDTQRKYYSSGHATEAYRPYIEAAYPVALVEQEVDGVKKSASYGTLNEAFNAITSSGTITLYDNIKITSRCNTNDKTISVIPAKAGITISSSINNSLWLLNNNSKGTLTIGCDEYELTIDGNNVTNSSNHVEASGGTTTIKNVRFRNCVTSSTMGVVCHKSGGQIHLLDVTFQDCSTTQSGRGIVFAGSTGLHLEGSITFENCNEYNFYQENERYLNVGYIGSSQVAPFTTYYENAALGNRILSSSTGENRSDLFKLVNEGYGIVKTADHWTDHFITEAYDLTVSDAKAATLVLPYEAKMPTGVKAYTLNYTAGNSSVKATEVGTNIPKNTPVLLNAEAGTYKFTNAAKVTEATVGAGTVTSGALTGVYAETVVPSGSYILYNKDGVGFYKVDGSTNKVAANRAYLTADGAGVRALTIDFSGEETGINAIDNGQLTMDNAVYDLSGRRVSRPTKGLYIMNGKKVVLK